MAIKFTCPHCGKHYSVKDQLAGKKAACKDCKKVLTIPAPTAAPAPLDVEALAAAAFTDAPAPAPVEDKRTIDFECPQCGEPVQQPFELAGKQAPCPSCRRIIKVPLPVKNEPKDWRKIDTRGPSAAKANLEPAPEGAWGSATSAGMVSRQALIDAAAIPEIEEEPTSRRQWIVRGAIAASVLCVLGLGVWGVWGLVAKSRQIQQRRNRRSPPSGRRILPPRRQGRLHSAGRRSVPARPPGADTHALPRTRRLAH